MNSFGPQYCETALGGGVFPVELINTFTSLIPTFFGLGVLIWLIYFKHKDFVPYVLASLLFLTGVGSTLWHGFRTPLALALDVLPGLFFFFTLLFVWPATLKNRWYGYFTIILAFSLQWVVGLVLNSLGGGFRVWPIFFVAIGIGIVLVFLTRSVNKKAGAISGMMLLSAMLAAAARTYDPAVCSTFPAGSHFAWHILLGLSGLLAILLMVELRKNVRVLWW